MPIDVSALWIDHHSWMIGFVVVVVTSYSRFNTPPTSRSSTTWGRYHALATVYTVALLASWVVLANAPELFAKLAASADVSGELQDLDAPIYAALLLTALAGSVAPFTTFDARIRQFLQELARIPWEVQRLSSALRAPTWLPGDELQAKVRELLTGAGFADPDMCFSCARTPQAVWTRVTTHRVHLDDWKRRPRGRFAAFYFKNVTAVLELNDRHQQLQDKARRVLQLLSVSGGSAGGPDDTSGIRDELIRGFMVEIARLEKDYCDMLSRGILTCGLTEGARRAEFEAMGFTVNVTPSRLFDKLLGLYCCLALWYMAVLTVFSVPMPWLTGLDIATIYIGAVATSLYVKRKRGETAPGDGTPVTDTLIAAGAAFLIGSLTTLALGLLTYYKLVPAWRLFVDRLWPWDIMAAIVAGLLIWLAEPDEGRHARSRECAIGGVVCALAAIPVVYLVHQACTCANPPVLRVIVNALITGALVGWFVPTWYRRPQVVVSEYRGRSIAVTLRARRGGGVTAAVEIAAAGAATAGGRRVGPDRAGDSAEEILGEAIRDARLLIDEEIRPANRETEAVLATAETWRVRHSGLALVE